jgi:hypothetical protein
MTDLQSKQLAVLDATCAEYNTTNRATDGNACLYWDPNTQRRCAIGRLLTVQQAMHLQTSLKFVGVLLDNLRASTNDIEKSIYNTLSGYSRGFLRDLQELHDCELNWDNKGLSERGREYADNIKHCIINNEYT